MFTVVVNILLYMYIASSKFYCRNKLPPVNFNANNHKNFSCSDIHSIYHTILDDPGSIDGALR